MAVLSGFLFSCQSDPVQETRSELQGFQAELVDEDGDPCDPGTEIDFALDTRMSGTPSFSLAAGVSVNNHATLVPEEIFDPATDCLCEVTHYIMDYNDYPTTFNSAGTTFQILDPAGDPIPYTAVGTNPTRIIIDQDDIVGNLYVVTDDNLDPQPTLVLAGGLCMIENVSNPPPTGEIMVPYRELDYNERGEVIGTKYYLPTAGLPYNEILKTLK